jgi:hypothetical protein
MPKNSRVMHMFEWKGARQWPEPSGNRGAQEARNELHRLIKYASEECAFWSIYGKVMRLKIARF